MSLASSARGVRAESFAVRFVAATRSGRENSVIGLLDVHQSKREGDSMVFRILDSQPAWEILRPTTEADRNRNLRTL
nr:hypothetical protein CFP56_63750 [Quercus suber]